MILTPFLLPLLDDCTADKALDCDIVERDGLLRVALYPYKKGTALTTSPNMFVQVKQLVARVKKGWDPEDKSQSLLFNKKSYATLYDAWRAIRNGKEQVA